MQESQEQLEARKREQTEINKKEAARKALEGEYGQTWDTKEAQEDFNIVGFMAPFVVAVRKSDQVKGTLTFQDMPRFYFDFNPA